MNVLPDALLYILVAIAFGMRNNLTFLGHIEDVKFVLPRYLHFLSRFPPFEGINEKIHIMLEDIYTKMLRHR